MDLTTRRAIIDNCPCPAINWRIGTPKRGVSQPNTNTFFTSHNGLGTHPICMSYLPSSKMLMLHTSFVEPADISVVEVSRISNGYLVTDTRSGEATYCRSGFVSDTIEDMLTRRVHYVAALAVIDHEWLKDQMVELFAEEDADQIVNWIAALDDEDAMSEAVAAE